MNQYFMRFPGNRTKAVTLSYDDGNRNDLKLLSIINKYGLKCTFNLCSALLGGSSESWYLTAKEIQDNIVSAGHEVAVHTAHHKAPGLTDLTDGIKEVLEGRAELERTFGGIIKGMAYPNSGIQVFNNGFSYNDVKKYLRDLGIAYARSLGGDNDGFMLPEDWYDWRPTAHHDNPKLIEYVDKFLSLDVNSEYIGSQWPRLFYLWGHSFEYQANDNWSVLTDFCERISGREDIWYATNIEIYNYTMAYRSLMYNVDRTFVYNPTLHTVWMRADDRDYCIRSGETVSV